MCELKPKEKMVYDAIVEWIGKNGYSPTLRELGIKVGIESTSTIYHIIKNLEVKGYIDTVKGKKRVISLNGNTAKGKTLNGKPIDVVLCKDCKFRHKTNMGVAIWVVCHKLNRKTDDDFYCAYGEVKE